MAGRSSPRIKVKDISAKIKKRGFFFGHGKEQLVKIIDIGPNGLSFEFTQIVDPDTQFDFVLIIPKVRTLKCSGAVRSLRKINNNRYILGLKFTKLSQSDKKFLKKKNIFEIAEVNILKKDMLLKTRLRALRSASGFTITELAEMTGVSSMIIKQIEYGMEKTPAKEILLKLADGLGISANELSGQNENQLKKANVS